MAFDQKEEHFVTYDGLMREWCGEGRDLVSHGNSRGKKVQERNVEHNFLLNIGNLSCRKQCTLVLRQSLPLWRLQPSKRKRQVKH